MDTNELSELICNYISYFISFSWQGGQLAVDRSIENKSNERLLEHLKLIWKDLYDKISQDKVAEESLEALRNNSQDSSSLNVFKESLVEILASDTNLKKTVENHFIQVSLGDGNVAFSGNASDGISEREYLKDYIDKEIDRKLNHVEGNLFQRFQRKLDEESVKRVSKDNSSVFEDQPKEKDKESKASVDFSARKKSYSRVIQFLLILLFATLIMSFLGQFFISEALAAPDLVKTNNLSSPQLLFGGSQIGEFPAKGFLFQRNRVRDSLNKRVLSEIRSARNYAEVYASDSVDNWIDDLKYRVDNSFLEWYFSFTNKRWREDRAVVGSVLSKIGVQEFDVKKSFASNFKDGFYERVIDPASISEKYEKIRENTLKVFLTQLSYKLPVIKSDYSIPDEEWEDYINQISLDHGIFSNKELFPASPSLGSIIFAGNKAGSIAFAKLGLQPLSVKGEALSLKMLQAASTKFGLKFFGGALLSKLSGAIDPAILIGLPLYEVWHYYSKEMPPARLAMRESLEESLKELGNEFLFQEDIGIMVLIDDIELSVRKSFNL